MARPSARQILAELLPVLLVLICLGGSLALVIATHRRFPPQPEPVAIKEPAPAPEPVAEAPEPDPDPEPAPKPAPEPPPDPTEPILAEIARQIADEKARTKAAEEQIQASETAIATAESEVEKLTQQEALLESRAAELDRQADLLDREATLLAKHRDVLAQKRDEQIQELARLESRSRDSYAVLPYRGENGTWRRPIAIECRDGTAKLQPDGRTYSMLELTDGLGLRGSPIVSDVAREIIKASGETTPDGSRIIPYILFVIRPDGVRAYYEARGQLERLGIAFGYELVGDDMAIDYPSADDPTRWSDSEPAHGDVLAQAGAHSPDNPYVWPKAPPPPPRSGLSPSELDLLNALNQPSGELGSSGRPGPFPTIPDGPPIPYVPDPRPLARMNGQAGAGEFASGPMAPGSGRSGSGPGVLPPAPRGGYGSSPVAEAEEGRGSTGLNPDGLGLQPMPPTPGSERGLYRGSEPSSNQTSDLAGATSGSEVQAAPTSGPFPTAPPGGFPRGAEDGVLVENRAPGGVAGPSEGALASNGTQKRGGGSGSAPKQTGQGMGPSPGGPASSRRSGSGSSAPTAPRGLAGGVGTPSDVTPGSTALGGSSGVNPLGAVIARALANGSGLGGGTGQESASELGRFRDQLAEASGSGSGSAGQDTGGRGSGTGSKAGGSGTQGNGQGTESSLTASSSAAGGPSGGSGAPKMVSTTLRHPKSWMNDKSLPITLACGPNGVLIQPGGYRLSRGTLESGHLLHDRLKAIVKNAEKSAHGQPVKPKVQFVIEPGGEETFWLVRRQTVFAGTDWPATVRLVESGGLDVFSGRLRR